MTTNLPPGVEHGPVGRLIGALIDASLRDREGHHLLRINFVAMKIYPAQNQWGAPPPVMDPAIRAEVCDILRTASLPVISQLADRIEAGEFDGRSALLG